MEIETSKLIAKIKETGKHFVIYGFGNIIQGLVGILLLPLLSKYYVPSIYGQYTIILLLGTLSGSLMYLGATSAFARFYFDKDNINYKKQITTNSFILVVFGAIFQSILFLLLAPVISIKLFETKQLELPIILSIITSSLGIVNTYLLVYIRTQKKSFQFILVNSINFSSNFFITYILLDYRLVSQIVIAPFLGIIFGNTLSIFILVKSIRSQLNIKYVSKNIIVTILKFGIPTIITGFIYYLLDWADRFLIEYFGSLKDVGIYSFGYKIGMLIQMAFIIPFSMIWSTLRMEHAKDKDTGRFFSVITTYYTIIGLSIVLFVSLFSKQIVIIFASNPQYFISYQIIPWVIFGHLFYGYINILDFGIYYSTKVFHYSWIFSLVLLLNVTLNYLLLPIFGYYIAAVNTTISYFILIMLIYWVSNKFYLIKVETKRILILYFSTIISIIISSTCLNSKALFYNIILFIVTVLFWIVFIPTKTERGQLKNFAVQFLRLMRIKG